MKGVVFSRLSNELIYISVVVTIFFSDGGLRYKYVNVCLPPFTARAWAHWVWWSTQLCCVLKVGVNRERVKEGKQREKWGEKKKKRWRGGWGGVYIINYDFITCSQFLGDLLFRGALMNNKRKGWRERKGVIDEASADTATSWPSPVLPHKQECREMYCL